MTDKDQKPTIETERRRPGSGKPPAERERAEAPARQRERPSPAGSAGRPSTGGLGSGGTSGGGDLIGTALPLLQMLTKSPLGIALLVLLLCCGLPLYLYLGGGLDLSSLGGSGGLGDVATPVVQDSGPTPTRRPTRPPATPGAGQTWTIMMYQDADDKVLEQDIFVDLNEAERVGSSGNVNIVAQIDRYQGGFAGDGNWTGTRRYYVRQDDDLNTTGSDMVMDLGEVNMADAATLIDFVDWAAQNYPADKYVLILSDHGMGWPGGWSDATAPRRGSNVPLEAALGDNIYLQELDQALAAIRSRAGIDKFEMIGMDACLMGHIEVMSALAPHARYAVLSQETEPALGWAYAAFLGELVNDPGITGAELGQAIVDSYIVEDERIVNDSARADLVGRGSPLGSLFGGGAPSADQVASQMAQNITLAAVDLQALPDLMSSLDKFAVALQGANQRNVAQARSYAQSFTNIFGREVPPAYIDLGNFAQLVAQSSGAGDVTNAAKALQTSLNGIIVAEKHGSRLAGATGISIYFPNSQLYGAPAAGPESYTVIAGRFASESLWDDFLAFHYTGEKFDASQGTAAVPPVGARRAPAAGGIQVSGITASATAVSIGETVRLTVDIEGENLGYVKLLVGYLDQDHRSLYVADSDYLASPNTREAGGIYYPDWGVTSFTMAFKWEPIVYAIDDGTTRYPALFTPDTYGRSSEEAVYTVDGIYTFSDSGDQRNARLYFVNGVLQQVYGFTGEDAASAPREIIPRPGDTFTLLEKWMDLDSQGQVEQVVYQPGKTLTFSDRMFTWEVLDAAAGQYVVGFIIEDLDGNSQVVFEPITVR